MMDSVSEVECRVLPGVVSNKEDGYFAKKGQGSSKIYVDLDGKAHVGTDLMKTEKCLACDGTESLLVCNENECGFAVHEKCLPCSAYFDESGSFYCPQCSYERAVEKCSIAKKRASLTKQALLKFISGNDYQPEVETTDGIQPSPSTSQRDVDHLTQAGEHQEKRDSDMCNRTDLSDTLLKEHCANPNEYNSRKTVDHVVHPISSLESEKAKNMGYKKTFTSNSASNQGMQAHEFATCTKHTSTSQNCRTENLHTSGVGENEIRYNTHQNCVVDDLVGRVPEVDNGEANGGRAQPQVLQKTDSPPGPGSMEKHHDTESGPVNDMSKISTSTKRKRGADKIRGDGRDNLYVEESDISDSDVGTMGNKKPIFKRHQKERRAKFVQRGTGSNHSDIQNVIADECVKGSRARELARSSLKNKSNNTDNQVKSGTSPYTRRRVQWTVEEVDILKEGVQKFSAPNKNIPWGRILEYGSRVFHRSRAASDLKDKWRKLTK